MRMKKARGLLFVMAAAAALAVLASAQSAETAKDPVCGMSVAKASAPWTYAYKGQTFYFCGESCRTRFAADPEKYLAAKAESAPPAPDQGQAPMRPGQAAAAAQAKDPVCGMTVDKASARWTSAYRGTTYFFCSESCKTAFDKDPAKYATAPSGAGRGPGAGIMSLADVVRTVEITKDGFVVTFRAKDPASIKKLHEHAARMTGASGK
jgi:YHS domain-containing protein